MRGGRALPKTAVLLIGLLAPLLLHDVAPASATDTLTITPNPLGFGSVPKGQIGEAFVTAKNSASFGARKIQDVKLEGAQPAAFHITNDGCSRVTLAPGATCDVRVEFGPNAVGPFTASLSFETATGPVATVLSGQGVAGAPTSVAQSPPFPTIPTTATPPTSGPPVSPTIPVYDTPPPPPTVPRSDQDRLSECERLAQTAKVSYEPTRKMLADQTASVRVTASVDGGDAATTVVTTPVPTTVVITTLRCEVQAQLRGLDFKIEPAGFQQGSFLDRPTIVWSWDVVPLNPGRTQLTLEIRSVAEVAGRRIEGAGGELYVSAIQVDTKTEGLGEKVRRWSGDIVDHPLVKGFGSLLLVLGTLAGWWRGLLKRPWPWRRRVPSEEAPAPPVHEEEPVGSAR